MTDYPLGENPGDPDTVVIGRIANVLVPVVVTDGTGADREVKILMSMPERDARLIMHMPPVQSADYGVFFDLLRTSITTFMIQEG